LQEADLASKNPRSDELLARVDGFPEEEREWNALTKEGWAMCAVVWGVRVGLAFSNKGVYLPMDLFYDMI
jgi:hypothetical protein